MGRFSDPAWDGDGLAIVLEQLAWIGGTQRVAAAVAERWPGAQVVASQFLAEPEDSSVPECLRDARRIEIPGPRRHVRASRYARRIARSEPVDADVVLAFHAAGWGAAIRTSGRMVAYCAGPARSLYHSFASYVPAYPHPARMLAAASLPALRAHQRRMLRRTDRLVANSRWAASKLARNVGRPVSVVYPPVRLSELTPTGPRPEGPLLTVARLSTRQKRIATLMEAVRGLDRELVIAGTGPLLEPLRRAAPSNVRFVGGVSDAELTRLYRSASALICPSVEEFGLVMAEAHACGLPVIAPRAGAAPEIVEHGRTGLLVEDAGPAGLREAIRSLGEREFDRQACRRSAERFGEERFTGLLAAQLDAALGRAPATGLTDHPEAFPGRPLPESVA